MADSNLSFLYSVKFDPVVLSLDREGAEELEAHIAALEVADSVLDVRHAFFQASTCTLVLTVDAWLRVKLLLGSWFQSTRLHSINQMFALLQPYPRVSSHSNSPNVFIPTEHSLP